MSHGQLRLWPALAGPRIAPGIYGHQLEMVGRCIYDGLWSGRASRSATEDGIRLEVLAVLKHLRIPLLRWPGDAFGAHYHWRDGVGSGERPHRMNIPFQQVEPNAFGFHEFMDLCEKLECTPWITGNGTTGTAEEALAWLEYATFGGETDRSRDRAQNGYPDPFEVPLWSMSGTENRAVADAMVALNPDVVLVTPLDGDGMDKAAPSMERAPTWKSGGLVSMSHFFRPGPGRGFGRKAYEDAFCDVGAFEARLARSIAGLTYRYGEAVPSIALRAWGTWHDEATVENGLEQPNTLRDALVAASVYNVLNQHAAHVRAAALAQAVNALQCLAVTEGSAMYLTPNYHVADLMGPHRGGRLITQRLETPEIDRDGEGEQTGGALPALSASASRTGKRVCVTVVNRSFTDAVPLSVELREAGIAAVSGRLLHADTAAAENSVSHPKNVAPRWLKLTPDGNTFQDTLPPHSMAAYTVTLGQG